MIVSIAIRTKNEAKAIGRTLHLIEEQSKIPDLEGLEIVVVDSGSTDETVSIIRAHGDIKLVEINSESFTFGRALNIGFEAARGDIAVSLSAHAFPCNKQWLKHLIKHFDDPQVAGVYGRQLPHPDAWPPVKRDYLNAPYGMKMRVQKDPNEPRDHFFSNVNAAIRRKCWEKHPFDETLPVCEDWEWARAMLKLGHKIIYEPEAAVYHSHNESLIKVYQRCYREALAQKLLYQNREMTIRGAIKTWCNSILNDIRFILQNDKEYRWLLWTPIYRLFWTYGMLRPDMPAALWRPFLRRWKKLQGKWVSKLKRYRERSL